MCGWMRNISKRMFLNNKPKTNKELLFNIFFPIIGFRGDSKVEYVPELSSCCDAVFRSPMNVNGAFAFEGNVHLTVGNPSRGENLAKKK